MMSVTSNQVTSYQIYSVMFFIKNAILLKFYSQIEFIRSITDVINLTPRYSD